MPRTAAWLAMLMSLPLLGCAGAAPVVHPGLANAPRLDNQPVTDAAVRDVVANGRDSCERTAGPGPLRNEQPPCPAVERSAGAAPTPPKPAREEEIVMPWVEHYHSSRLCSSEGADGQARAASFTLALNGMACSGPL